MVFDLLIVMIICCFEEYFLSYVWCTTNCVTQIRNSLRRWMYNLDRLACHLEVGECLVSPGRVRDSVGYRVCFFAPRQHTLQFRTRNPIVLFSPMESVVLRRKHTCTDSRTIVVDSSSRVSFGCRPLVTYRSTGDGEALPREWVWQSHNKWRRHQFDLGW